MEWGELADKLDVARSTMDHVRKGKNPGPKLLRRIENWEAACGLRDPAEHIGAMFDRILNEPSGENGGRTEPAESGHKAAIGQLSSEVRSLRAQVESMRALLDAVAADVIRMKKPKE